MSRIILTLTFLNLYAMVVNMNNYNNIPAELKNLNQWICWQLIQESEDCKPTKVPIRAIDGKLASVINSNDWCSFDEACAASYSNSGIGFVITENDPYACIDLDQTDNAEIQQKQARIAEAFNSYSEISVSGKGLHLWVKGSIPAGRRRDFVEVYSSVRYMCMTGNIYNASPITDYQEQLFSLWETIGKEKNDNYDKNLNADQTQEDADIIKIASGAVNGEKFLHLHNGQWQQYYESQSQADFAYINMLNFYTKNRLQITRMFRNSALGQRPKALRVKYTESMIDRSFDLTPPTVDLDNLKNQLNEQFVAKKEKAAEVANFKNVKIEKGKVCDIPEGAVGELARFIYSASPRPVPEISLAAAIGFFSGMCGRAYNVSGAGLNSYVLVLGSTGVGKEAVSSGIDKIISYISKTVPSVIEFIGPGCISSEPALVKCLDKQSASFVSIIGEVGLMLKGLTSLRATPVQTGLKKCLLDLYGKSGKDNSYKPISYSDQSKNTNIINSPAFSLLGESTQKCLYEILSEEMVMEGLLPRFLIIDYQGDRPPLNPNHLIAKPDDRLIEYLSAIAAYALSLNNGNQVIDVELDEEATEIFRKFDKRCDKEINKTDSEVTKSLWTRVYLKSLKLAAVIAVGCNYITPVINKKSALYAIDLIESDTLNILSRFEKGEVGTATIQNNQLTDLKKAISLYLADDFTKVSSYNSSSLQTHNAKVIPHGFLLHYCRQRRSFKDDRINPTNAVKTLLISLIEAGDICEVSVQQKQEKKLPISGKLYAVTNIKFLDN
jgi:hypothetical protein